MPTKTESRPEIVEIDGGQAIQYVQLDRSRVAVYLGKPQGVAGRRYQRTGMIRLRNATRPGKAQGWQYVPNGQRTGGELFTDLAACKRSVEGRDEKPEEFTPAFLVAGMNPNDWRKNK